MTERDPWEFDPALAADELARHFGVMSIAGLGIGDRPLARWAPPVLCCVTSANSSPAGVPHLARPVLSTAAGPCRSTR